MSVRFDHENVQLPLRPDILEILQAGLVGADPHRAVRNTVERDGMTLRIGEREVDLETVEDVFVVGAGKAAASMAKAVEDIVGDRISDGVVTVKDGYTRSTSSIAVGEAAHPVPDERSVKATRAVTHIAGEATREDLVLALFSGGGSSVLELPAGALSLEHIQEMTTTLLASGLDIDAVNTVRKHLSGIKGGQLAELLMPAQLATVVVSDVVGDRLDTVASGPTVPDPTTFRDALDALERADLTDRTPRPVLEHLEAGTLGERDETPAPGHEAFERASTAIATDRTDAVEAAEKAAAELEYETHVATTELDGEARDVGRQVARRALEIVETGEPVYPPACVLFAGETTVTVRGRGKGGPNQELALSAAMALDEAPDSLEHSVAIAAFATDGTDGPTRAAGAIVDPESARRGRDAGYDLRDQLQANNSYQVLGAAGELLITGPTNNNVNDLVCVLVE